MQNDGSSDSQINLKPNSNSSDLHKNESEIDNKLQQTDTAMELKRKS